MAYIYYYRSRSVRLLGNTIRDGRNFLKIHLASPPTHKLLSVAFENSSTDDSPCLIHARPHREPRNFGARSRLINYSLRNGRGGCERANPVKSRETRIGGRGRVQSSLEFSRARARAQADTHFQLRCDAKLQAALAPRAEEGSGSLLSHHKKPIWSTTTKPPSPPPRLPSARVHLMAAAAARENLIPPSYFSLYVYKCICIPPRPQKIRS